MPGLYTALYSTYGVRGCCWCSTVIIQKTDACWDVISSAVDDVMELTYRYCRSRYFSFEAILNAMESMRMHISPFLFCLGSAATAAVYFVTVYKNDFDAEGKSSALAIASNSFQGYIMAVLGGSLAVLLCSFSDYGGRYLLTDKLELACLFESITTLTILIPSLYFATHSHSSSLAISLVWPAYHIQIILVLIVAFVYWSGKVKFPGYERHVHMNCALTCATYLLRLCSQAVDWSSNPGIISLLYKISFCATVTVAARSMQLSIRKQNMAKDRIALIDTTSADRHWAALTIAAILLFHFITFMMEAIIFPRGSTHRHHMSSSFLSASYVVLSVTALALLIISKRRDAYQGIKSRTSLEIKRLFVKYVTHELRGPLNATLAGLNIITDDVEAGKVLEPLSLTEMLEDASGPCSIAINILNDLLMYEKIDGGFLTLERAETNVWEFVDGSLKAFLVQAKKSNIELAWPKRCVDGVFVEIDRYKLSQVLRNLISNALKFTPSGGKVRVIAQVMGVDGGGGGGGNHACLGDGAGVGGMEDPPSAHLLSIQHLASSSLFTSFKGSIGTDTGIGGLAATSPKQQQPGGMLSRQSSTSSRLSAALASIPGIGGGFGTGAAASSPSPSPGSPSRQRSSSTYTGSPANQNKNNHNTNHINSSVAALSPSRQPSASLLDRVVENDGGDDEEEDTMHRPVYTAPFPAVVRISPEKLPKEVDGAGDGLMDDYANQLQEEEQEEEQQQQAARAPSIRIHEREEEFPQQKEDEDDLESGFGGFGIDSSSKRMGSTLPCPAASGAAATGSAAAGAVECRTGSFGGAGESGKRDIEAAAKSAVAAVTGDAGAHANQTANKHRLTVPSLQIPAAETTFEGIFSTRNKEYDFSNLMRAFSGGSNSSTAGTALPRHSGSNSNLSPKQDIYSTESIHVSNNNEEEESQQQQQQQQQYAKDSRPTGQIFPTVATVRICVIDSGAGISKENREQLFNEIVQFNSGKLQVGTGSCIGMWISNTIAKLHGGSIGVVSHGEGQGSTFYIDIPISRIEPGSNFNHMSPPRRRGTKTMFSSRSRASPSNRKGRVFEVNDRSSSLKSSSEDVEETRGMQGIQLQALHPSSPLATISTGGGGGGGGGNSGGVSNHYSHIGTNSNQYISPAGNSSLYELSSEKMSGSVLGGDGGGSNNNSNIKPGEHAIQPEDLFSRLQAAAGMESSVSSASNAAAAATAATAATAAAASAASGEVAPTTARQSLVLGSLQPTSLESMSGRSEDQSILTPGHSNLSDLTRRSSISSDFSSGKTEDEFGGSSSSKKNNITLAPLPGLLGLPSTCTKSGKPFFADAAGIALTTSSIDDNCSPHSPMGRIGAGSGSGSGNGSPNRTGTTSAAGVGTIEEVEEEEEEGEEDDGVDEECSSTMLHNKNAMRARALFEKRILIVDDSATNRKFVNRMLRTKIGVRDEATNGQEALDKVMSCLELGASYDIILMDYQMPIMDGPTATKHMRDAGYSGCIIGISGNGMQSDLDIFTKAGTNRVLVKPISADIFMETLTELLLDPPGK